ncbi:MAG: LysR family transcriptional regulator [Pseudomonadota bacterium]
MDIASQMILFADVVDHGSLSATARDLGQTPSAVSKQISALEDRLGVRLLNRSTRQLSLTQEGHSFYQRCASISSQVREARELVEAMGGQPQGTLRIASTVAFAKAQLLPLLPEFLDAYPDLTVNLELTDRSIDLINSDYDVAIRFSAQIESSSVIARKLAAYKRVVCASPEYVARNGVPASLEDFSNHNCLRVSTVNNWNDWEFLMDGKDMVLTAQGNFEANSADAVYYATKAGLGISHLSTYMVAGDLRAGSLLQLFPEHKGEASGIYAVYASKHHLAPKIRVFIDYFSGKFADI